MASKKTKSKKSREAKEPKAPKQPDDGSADFDDVIKLGATGNSLMKVAAGIGIAGLVISMFLGASADDGYKQFFHSYLVAFMWALSISLGALWWVTLQHLVNAHWSIVVRRIGELLAQGLPLMLVMAVPIFLSMLQGSDALFPWVNDELMHNDHILHGKVGYLNVPFFLLRMAVYFGFWSLLAHFYLKRSVAQDQSRDKGFVATMAKVSPPSMIAIALTLTFCAVDFMMTLDPYWFSTIFGVYYFAGCVLAVHSTMTLALLWLQKNGRLTKSVTIEHYHDIGKMMFAFTVFWTYIAFSQFMLIWYANIPEETQWYKVRFNGDWAGISLVLLVAHFAIPFFGLLSRHIKRNPHTLSIGAVWILAVHFIDMHWIIMPNLHGDGFSWHLLDLTTWVGLGGLLLSFVLWRAQGVNLVPTRDPRLKKSLAFENI